MVGRGGEATQAAPEGERMRNFLTGLLLGLLSMYWYQSQNNWLRATVEDLWARASAPPTPITRRLP